MQKKKSSLLIFCHGLVIFISGLHINLLLIDILRSNDRSRRGRWRRSKDNIKDIAGLPSCSVESLLQVIQLVSQGLKSFQRGFCSWAGLASCVHCRRCCLGIDNLQKEICLLVVWDQEKILCHRCRWDRWSRHRRSIEIFVLSNPAPPFSPLESCRLSCGRSPEQVNVESLIFCRFPPWTRSNKEAQWNLSRRIQWRDPCCLQSENQGLHQSWIKPTGLIWYKYKPLVLPNLSYPTRSSWRPWWFLWWHSDLVQNKQQPGGKTGGSSSQFRFHKCFLKPWRSFSACLPAYCHCSCPWICIPPRKEGARKQKSVYCYIFQSHRITFLFGIFGPISWPSTATNQSWIWIFLDKFWILYKRG